MDIKTDITLKKVQIFFVKEVFDEKNQIMSPEMIHKNC